MQNRQNQKFYILGILLAVVVLLIFFNSLGWLGPVRDLLLRALALATRPFVIMGNKVSGAFGVAANLKNLINENSQLKQENDDLVLVVSKMAELTRENEILRRQLQLVPPIKSKMADANIIGFNPGNLGQYFLIDEGVSDGIQVNQAVIYSGGFLVGKVTEVSAAVSKVLALTDSQSSVFALSQDTRVSGVIKGDHGVGLILDMVPPEKEINDKEMIISSGLDSSIPRGLVIGQIEAKISTESEVFQRFKIKPAVNYKEIESVFVVLGNE